MMNVSKCVAAMCLLAMGASAQNITFSNETAPKTIVKIGADACLRGPLTISNPDGTVVFDLAAGIYFPSGCAQ